MDISDHELRTIVRAAIARHAPLEAGAPLVDRASDRRRASHALLRVAPGSDVDGSCLIEPAVRCSHCGYCQSYGH